MALIIDAFVYECRNKSVSYYEAYVDSIENSVDNDTLLEDITTMKRLHAPSWTF